MFVLDGALVFLVGGILVALWLLRIFYKWVFNRGFTAAREKYQPTALVPREDGTIRPTYLRR